MDNISTKFENGVAVFKRMRRVDVEESAAVRAQLLDGNLRSGRTNCQYLFSHRISICIGCGLEQRHSLVWAEGLHHALRNEHEGHHK